MAPSLDPVKNPILQVYEFFLQPGLQRIDKAEFLGFRKLKLKTITSRKAQDLITLLRATPDALNHFQLTLDNRRLIDFAPRSVTEWFDRETIEQFSGRLCADCMSTLASLRDHLDAFQEGASWAGEDLLKDNLGVLDRLAECHSCGEHFELDVKLDKNVLVKEYLLDEHDDLHNRVSSLLWYDSESLADAYDSYDSFHESTVQFAGRPIVILLYNSAQPYRGDFFKILPLTNANTPVNQREQQLETDVRAFTNQVFNDYEVLRLRHGNEHRPSGRLDLPPSLFLQRKEELAQYPSHPLFADGPYRSILIYAIMAWLAEQSSLDGKLGHFTLPSDAESHPILTLVFSVTDVQRDDRSIFDTQTDWRTILGLVVREIGQSAGNEQLRGYWTRALKGQSLHFTSTEFFKTLEAVSREFIRSKEEAPKVEATIVEHKVASPPGFIDILVFLDTTRQEIKFQLNSVSLGYVYEKVGEVRLGGADPDLRAAELSELAKDHLSSILVTHPTNPNAQVPSVDKLETRGVVLWRKLIPDDLKRAYIKLRERPDLTVFIVSDDPSFPWELVKPVEIKGGISTEGFDDMWWAVKFSVARWLSGAPSPASEIALNRICCIADENQLAATAKERDHLRKIGRTLDLPQTYDELISCLSTQDYDLIHFACHGNFNTNQPGESIVLLPDGTKIGPHDFFKEPIMTKISQNKPLVFLNSCNSGRTGPTLIGLAGWAKEFINMGCGAFIGCGWEVHDELAADFAIAFYDAFRGGMSMGKAVHGARREIREKDQGNSTWLAYYLYGNPNCVLRSG